ncbi:S-layer homology domain-containing protein [Paenibacillus sp. MER 99-2]|uniref:S-layer homology domain-containing protein n=1 Tax=Paenibacillus sp. MER 99-2 TaxID=2939572 RepID=UPI00203E0CE7|nr:S-layer homology domain-containing protein [Paenibacillus sp. MER 99-2]MCM3175003.1 S-layer homology domain-containing protein [Paenibacillus sp. MER 99-2]
MSKISRTVQLTLIALLLSNAVPVSAQYDKSGAQAMSASGVSSVAQDSNNTKLNDAMSRAVSMGIVKGDPNGDVRANDRITRQELAVILAQSLGLTVNKQASAPFADVPSNSWSAPYIQAVKQAGLLQGDAQGSYRPHAPITGQELVTVLVRATSFAKQEAQKGSLSSDWKGASSWATSYIETAEKAELLSEYQGELKVKQGLVRSEAVGMLLSAMFPETRLSVVQSIHGNQIQINGVTYQASEQVAGLLNEGNKAILNQAGIKFMSHNRTITEINELEIRTGGLEAAEGKPEFSNNLLLNGNGAVLNGDLTIKADFTSVQGLTVKGKLRIAPELEHDFYAQNIKVEQSVLVHGGDPNTVVFDNSVLNTVGINKTDVHVALTGNTSAQEVSVESNSTVDIAATATLPLLTIVEGPSQVELKGAIGTVILDSTKPLQLNGNVAIQQLKVEGTGAISLNAAGTVQQLQVNNPASQINVAGNVKVSDVSLAAGVASSAISGNTGTTTTSTTPTSSSGGASGAGTGSSSGGGGSEAPPVVANRSPELIKPFKNRKLTANGQAASLNLNEYVTDPDGDVISYTVSSSKSSVAKVVLTGTQLNIVPLEHGMATITIASNDGRGKRLRSTFEVNVNASPLASPIPDQEIHAGSDSKNVDLSIYFMDDEKYESELLYSVTNTDSDIVGTEVNGTILKLTPKKVGETVLKVKVDDQQVADDGSTGVTEVELRIVVLPHVNRVPVGAIPAKVDVYLGDVIPGTNLNEHYTDPDGDPLSYTASSSNPAGLAVEEDAGVLTLSALQLGTYTVAYTVNDGNGGIVSESFEVEVLSMPNQPPVLTDSPPKQFVVLGKSDRIINLSNYFWDPEGEELNYVASLDNPDDVSMLEPSVADNELTLHAIQTGTTKIKVVASDPQGQETVTYIDVTVVEAGTIATIPDQTITWPWTTLDMDLAPYLSGFDTSTLSVNAITLNENIATVSTDGLQVKITPVAEGNTKVVFMLHDQSGRSEQALVGLVVQGEHASSNTVPEVVSTIYDQVLTPNVTNDRTFDLGQLFSDPDGDSLQFTISNSSNEAVDASINGSMLTLKPGTGNAVAPLTVTADDGKGGKVDYTFNVRTATLVNSGVIQVRTKSGVRDPLTFAASNWFPGQSSFQLYSGTAYSTFTGPDIIPSSQIPLTVSPLLFWIIGNDGRAVVVQVNSTAQGTPELFFSQYVDAGAEKVVVQVHYTGGGDPSLKASGYQLEVHQWMNQASTKRIVTENLYDIPANMPGIYINFAYYDFMDDTHFGYYNSELPLYNPVNPNEYNVVALVLKKDGRVVDVLGDPNSHERFMPAGGTIVRKGGIYTGSQQFSLTGEWNEFPKGTIQYIGYHNP